jgi:diguanylate cyclase (GGDEF)-like protein/PAS domain S-box-containing protein
MTPNSLLNRKLQLAFGSALLTLLVVGVFSYQSLIVSRESDFWVRHTHEVLERLEDLRSAIQSLESSDRGYLVTGDESFLTSYHAGILTARKDETLVRNLTVDNSSQQIRMTALESLTDQKFRLAEEIVTLRRSDGFEAASASKLVASGKPLMDRIQVAIGQMQDEEQRLLILRDADSARRLRQTKLVLALGTVLGLLIAAAAIWSVRRDQAARAIAEEALREGEERFRNMANHIPQLAWMADEKGYIFWYNKRWFDYTGTTIDEMAGWGWQKVHHPDHVQRVVDKISGCFQTGEFWEDTFPLRGRDGKYRQFLSRATPIRDAQGKVLRWFGTNTDVTETKEMEEALFVEKERAQATLNSIGDAVISTDTSGNISFLNRVAEQMTGWFWKEAAGRPMSEVFKILDAATRQTIPDPMAMAIGQNRSMSLPLNCLLIQRGGLEIPIEDSVCPIHNREGDVTGAVMVFRDVSEARAMALKMAHSAQHDFLTGLPNRMLLNDRVSQAITLALRHAKKLAVLFLDLDGFKHINDSLGHPIGDRLLQSVAARLVDCVRASDTVSRQGGDEFVVLLAEMEQPEDAAITARRLLLAVAAPHSIGGHDLHVTTSIGVSVFPDDGADAETLIKNSDTAMYQAKEHGRQSYQFFKPAMNVRAVERQSIEESLRRALERQEFSLQYQPKINLHSGEITGAEALLRWNHPERGLVPPGLFIPVAEDCGLILPIGNWVLREACRQARAWIDAGLPLGSMAVNISAMEFTDENFLSGVFAILEDTRLDPRSLELELTESVLMKHVDSTESILKILREKGVQVAVDDFGTGYSSLSYLRKFSIDALKIDQSFVRQITTSPDETTIVTAVISMGRSLKLRVVAEGVETLDQLEFLRDHHCEEAQGYYFSRPISPQQFAKLLETGLSEKILALSPAAVIVGLA